MKIFFRQERLRWRSSFLELGELMCLDALQRNESSGGHFQTSDGEAKRDDENFAYVSAWEWTGTE